MNNKDGLETAYKYTIFLFMAFCMLLTAATELGTNQWIGVLLENVGVPAILILVWINGLMAVGRQFAGRWCIAWRRPECCSPPPSSR